MIKILNHLREKVPHYCNTISLGSHNKVLKVYCCNTASNIVSMKMQNPIESILIVTVLLAVNMMFGIFGIPDPELGSRVHEIQSWRPQIGGRFLHP